MNRNESNGAAPSISAGCRDAAPPDAAPAAPARVPPGARPTTPRRGRADVRTVLACGEARMVPPPPPPPFVLIGHAASFTPY